MERLIQSGEIRKKRNKYEMRMADLLVMQSYLFAWQFHSVPWTLTVWIQTCKKHVKSTEVTQRKQRISQSNMQNTFKFIICWNLATIHSSFFKKFSVLNHLMCICTHMYTVLCNSTGAVNKMLIKDIKWAPSIPGLSQWDTSKTRQKSSKKQSSQNTNLMVLCTTNYFSIFFCIFWGFIPIFCQHRRRKTQTLQVSITQMQQMDRWKQEIQSGSSVPLTSPMQGPSWPTWPLGASELPLSHDAACPDNCAQLWFPQENLNRCQELLPCETATAASLWSQIEQRLAPHCHYSSLS